MEQVLSVRILIFSSCLEDPDLYTSRGQNFFFRLPPRWGKSGLSLVIPPQQDIERNMKGDAIRIHFTTQEPHVKPLATALENWEPCIQLGTGGVLSALSKTCPISVVILLDHVVWYQDWGHVSVQSKEAWQQATSLQSTEIFQPVAKCCGPSWFEIYRD